MNYCDVCIHFKRIGKTDEKAMPLGHCYGYAWIDGKPDEIRADAVACDSFIDVADKSDDGQL